MKRYLRLYKSLLRFSFLNYTTFRAHFINGIIASSGMGVFRLFGYICLLCGPEVLWLEQE